MHLSSDIFSLAYLAAIVFFIFGLKGLSHPKTALRGNRFSMLGMGLAVAVTLAHPTVTHLEIIGLGLMVGAVIGIPIALKIKMTAMPQLVAALHSFVGLAAVLVAAGTYLIHAHEGALNGVLLFELVLGSAIGAITFTGSLVAFGKLQALLGSAPLVFRGQHLFNAVLMGVIVVGSALFVRQHSIELFALVTAVSLLL